MPIGGPNPTPIDTQGKKPAVISPLALETVRRIDELFEIERAINGQTPERRRAVRQELSAPLVANLEAWMREQRAKLSRVNRFLPHRVPERVRHGGWR